MLKLHVTGVQKAICSLAITHPAFISEDTASATSALSAEQIKKTISTWRKEDTLSSAPFPKGLQEIRGSTYDRKKRNNKSGQMKYLEITGENEKP